MKRSTLSGKEVQGRRVCYRTASRNFCSKQSEGGLLMSDMQLKLTTCIKYGRGKETESDI